MLPVKTRKDPAPSRLAYRLERLWLRPAIRNCLRVGLPLAALALIAGLAARDPEVRGAVAARADALRDAIAAHPALRVERTEVSAVSRDLGAALAPMLDLDLPQSSMDLDLAALRARVAALPAVAGVRVRIEGETLFVDIAERHPAVVARIDGALWLLDAEGTRLRQVPGRAAAPGLPLIAGAGADAEVREALRLMERAAPLGDRVRGLVRVGERRWTLETTGGVEIMLPADGAAAALSRVVALESAYTLLSREITHVDMRDPRRPTLRMTREGAEALRALRALDAEKADRKT